MHVDCRLQTICVERKWFAQKTSNKVFIIETSIIAKTSSVLQIVSSWQTHQIFRIFKYIRLWQTTNVTKYRLADRHKTGLYCLYCCFCFLNWTTFSQFTFDLHFAELCVNWNAEGIFVKWFVLISVTSHNSLLGSGWWIWWWCLRSFLSFFLTSFLQTYLSVVEGLSEEMTFVLQNNIIKKITLMIEFKFLLLLLKLGIFLVFVYLLDSYWT